MKHIEILAGSVSLAALVCVGEAAGANAPVAATPAPRRVLILGDSISIGYTPFVRELLKGEATVVRPTLADGKPENCDGTSKGAREIARWLALGGGRWDVIHFNFGLHDLKRVHPQTGAASNDPSHPRQAGLEHYEKQLRQIARQLKATGARLILATTTPVPPGGVRPHRDVEDVPRYNAVALRVAQEFGMATNDLYAFALPRLGQIQQATNVHFTTAGSRLLAAEVVRHVRLAFAPAAP